MLGKTSVSAIRTLLLLAQQEDGACLPPRKLAERLGESPTYLAKVARHMVKHGILEAAKGVKGGVRLVRRPQEITLLAIVEACQGTIAGNYCRSTTPSLHECSFHKAATELHHAITGVLERWTLADLLEQPVEMGERGMTITCLMAGGLNPRPAARTAAPGGLMQLGI
ncbi:MAG: hypothetical protein C0504_04255 [Candidatus Solibacter sp.]|nr:hypothetical protein [Candidatus Solibacter sp.]